MEGHRLRVGALAWSSSMLSSGSRDKSILQRDPRAQQDFVSKLNGHKSEARFSFLNSHMSYKIINQFCTLSICIFINFTYLHLPFRFAVSSGLTTIVN